MPTDRLRDRWARDEPAVNAWVMGSDAAIPASLAAAGFDGVTADLQHGRHPESSLDVFAARVELAGAVPMVRLRWNDPAEVMRVLDLGVRGVIAPMIGSADEAARLVAAARYPPEGMRSYGPVAGAFGSGREQTAVANAHVLVFAMIETAGGLADVDAIAATPGLDGLYVGPADLGLSLGLASFADLRDERLLEALAAVLEACRRHGIVPGVHAPTADKSVEMVERGFRLVTPLVDEDGLTAVARDTVARTRSAISERRASDGDPSRR
ncbi:MAG TPA: aldolase/citrate lyase family protein [Actinomycetota bacterium]|nr:aldolase/citrate lyase family protein [Actinomycetota bacterium]